MPACTSITAGSFTRKISFIPASISRVTLALPPSSISSPITSQACGQPRWPATIEPVEP